MPIAIITALYVGMPLLGWALRSRYRSIGLTVGIPLAAGAGGVTALVTGLLYLPARVDLVVAYLPVSLITITAGTLVEWRVARRTGVNRPAVPVRRMVGGGLLAVYFLASIPAIPLAAQIRKEPFVPDRREADRLPPGMVVLADRKPPGGSGTAYRVLTIGSRDDLPADTVATQVRDALNRHHGWHLTGEEQECRRMGWLIDRRQLCVEVRVDSGLVEIELAGVAIY